MDEQRQDDQLEPIYNSSVPIQVVALKTSQEKWTIETGGRRGSGRFMLAARHDDDDSSLIINYTLYIRLDDRFYQHGIPSRVILCI